MKSLQKFMNFRISVDMLKNEFPSRKWKHCRNSWISEFPLTCSKMNFRQGNESTTEIHDSPNFRWHVEKWISVKEMKALQKFINFRISVDMLKTWMSRKWKHYRNSWISVDMLKTWISVKEMKALQKFMIFRLSVDMLKNEFPSRKWKHYRNSWISEFPLTSWKNMHFRQGNESTTEIHDFPNFRWHVEKWISVKEMKALQKFMNFRISVNMLKNEFPSRKWKHYRNSWFSEFPLTCWKHEFPSRQWKHYRNSWFSEFPLTSWKHEFLSNKWQQKWINLRFSAERLTNINSLPETEDKEKFCFY